MLIEYWIKTTMKNASFQSVFSSFFDWTKTNIQLHRCSAFSPVFIHFSDLICSVTLFVVRTRSQIQCLAHKANQDLWVEHPEVLIWCWCLTCWQLESRLPPLTHNLVNANAEIMNITIKQSRHCFWSSWYDDQPPLISGSAHRCFHPSVSYSSDVMVTKSNPETP